ncbi:MAG: hypothetical protein ACRD9Q_02190 [Nitrososphaeraceae archaeon]
MAKYVVISDTTLSNEYRNFPLTSYKKDFTTHLSDETKWWLFFYQNDINL